MTLCRRADKGECYLYDIDGRVVWRFDQPRRKFVPAEPLVHCMLRGSPMLTTEAACLGEGGALQDG